MNYKSYFFNKEIIPKEKKIIINNQNLKKRLFFENIYQFKNHPFFSFIKNPLNFFILILPIGLVEHRNLSNLFNLFIFKDFAKIFPKQISIEYFYNKLNLLA